MFHHKGTVYEYAVGFQEHPQHLPTAVPQLPDRKMSLTSNLPSITIEAGVWNMQTNAIIAVFVEVMQR